MNKEKINNTIDIRLFTFFCNNTIFTNICTYNHGQVNK